MNIPTLQNEESDLFDLSEFCHSLEMENFSNHMFFAHKGARTGAIGGDDLGPSDDPHFSAKSSTLWCLMIHTILE